MPRDSMDLGTWADWAVALATFALAVVAVGQDWFRRWFWRARLELSSKTEPPDCHLVPLARHDGVIVGNTYYLRVAAKNVGNTAATKVEVFAEALRRERADGTMEPVRTFPPMNLKWSNAGVCIYPLITAGTARHCDVCHVTDPAIRAGLPADDPGGRVAAQDAALVFDLMAAPNHKGHIVGPGNYELDVTVSAENVVPATYTLAIRLRGPWTADEQVMLRDYVGLTVKGRKQGGRTAHLRVGWKG